MRADDHLSSDQGRPILLGLIDKLLRIDHLHIVVSALKPHLEPNKQYHFKRQ